MRYHHSRPPKRPPSWDAEPARRESHWSYRKLINGIWLAGLVLLAVLTAVAVIIQSADANRSVRGERHDSQAATWFEKGEYQLH